MSDNYTLMPSYYEQVSDAGMREKVLRLIKCSQTEWDKALTLSV